MFLPGKVALPVGLPNGRNTKPEADLMGLFGGKRATNGEVDAWIAGATAAPPGAQVSGQSWTGPSFMRGLTAGTYTVTTLGSRSHLFAVLTRLAPQIDALQQNDTLHLQVAEPDAPGAPHTRLTIVGEKRDREWMQFLWLSLRTITSMQEKVRGVIWMHG